MEYPKELRDKIRLDIASDFIKGEFRKRFPSVKDFSYIDNDIDSLKNNIREFWNMFYAFAMSMHLLPTSVDKITAKNISWTLENFPIDNLIIGTNIKNVHNSFDSEIRTVKDMKDFLSKNSQKKKIMKEDVEKYTRLINNKDTFPYILIEKTITQNNIDIKGFSVVDGNHRLLWSILNNKRTVLSYVGRFTDNDNPRDFWLSTGLIMDIVKKFEIYDENIDNLLPVLKFYINLSPKIGKKELERAIEVLTEDNKNKIREYLDTL